MKPLSLADCASFSCATTPRAALLSFRAALNFLRALTVSGNGVVLLTLSHGCDSTCRDAGGRVTGRGGVTWAGLPDGGERARQEKLLDHLRAFNF